MGTHFGGFLETGVVRDATWYRYVVTYKDEWIVGAAEGALW